MPPIASHSIAQVFVNNTYLDGHDFTDNLDSTRADQDLKNNYLLKKLNRQLGDIKEV